MIRIMLLVVAGILALASNACAPQSAPIGAASGTGTGILTCAGTDFANSIQVLSTPFDPSSLTPPSGGTPLDKINNKAARDDLSAAFDAAPAKFKQTLCTTSVFVDQNAPFPWGFRKPNTSQRFIGLPGSLWGGGNLTLTSAGPYSAYENQLFAQVFYAAMKQPWDTSSAKPPAFGMATSSNTFVDTPATTVLAILAHEYGHILFYEFFKGQDPAATAINAQAFCRNPGSAVTGYFDNTWASITVPPNYWTGFGDATDLHVDRLVQIRDIQNELRYSRKNWANIATDVAAFYANDGYPAPSGRARSGLFPGLFGAISPIEDFVETFKFAVLTHPQANNGNPITSMPLYITSGFGAGTPFDIFADERSNKKQEFHRKKLCIYNRAL